jgi:predicted N-acetyltransferase YhbS
MERHSTETTSDEITIRLVELGDVPSLRRNCLSGWPLEALRLEVARNVAKAAAGDGFHFVAVAAGEVVGTACLEPATHRLQRHRAQVTGVVVTPAWQRRGVARRLIGAARERAAALGLRLLELACRGGEPAETAFRRLSFREYGRVPGGFVQPDGRVFDHVLLSLSVPAGPPPHLTPSTPAAGTSPAVLVPPPLPPPEEAEVVFRPRPDGAVRADLLHRGHSLSHLVIDPQAVRYGAATLRVDQLGDVWTEEACRGRGYARRLLTAATAHMRRGDGALSLLYGIGDFYHRFGYTTLGADYSVVLREADRGATLPDGWTVRPVRGADLPTIRALYEAGTQGSTLAFVRTDEASIWTKLAATARRQRDDTCRVVVDPEGNVGAYLWEGRGFWVVDLSRERWFPDDLTLGEVIAGSPAAADAALAAARQWAAEEAGRRGPRIRVAHCGAAPGSAIAAGAQYQEAAVHQTSWQSAGPQVRTLDTFRLLKGIEPELTRHIWRLGRLPARLRGAVRVQAETGATMITVQPERVDVRPATIAAGGAIREITLAQTTLIRLVLGALPPRDLLARSEPQLDAWAQEWLVALFPSRQPYMYPLDRS